MLNFGALIGFMGVKVAAFLRYYARELGRKLTNFVPPLIGFLVCLLLWLSLSRLAQVAGAIWMLAGIALGAWKTRGFQRELVNFDFSGEETVS